MCHSRLLDNETYQIKERLRAFAPRCKISSRIGGYMSWKFYDCRYRSTFVRLPWYLHAQPWNWKQVHGYARDKARGMKRRVSVCPLGGFSRRNARCWCKTSDISWSCNDDATLSPGSPDEIMRLMVTRYATWREILREAVVSSLWFTGRMSRAPNKEVNLRNFLSRGYVSS